MADVKKANVVFMDGKQKEAFKMYYEGARDGDAECAFNCGFCYLTGKGVENNFKQAKTFFNYSREIIPEANYNLAVMYLHGTGVERDYHKAYEYMYEAANSDIIEAQLYLGVAHTMGEMFEPEVAAISKIPFHTPVVREEIPMLEGDIPDASEDEEKRAWAVLFDPHAAFEWFETAAKHSSDYVEDFAVMSKFLYARCFVDGLGTDFDRDRANKLMLIAAADGSEDAISYLTTNAPYLLQELENPLQIEKFRQIERLGGGKKDF